MFFLQLFEPKLAQYSYIIGCQETGEAIVIDPMRDIERYIEEAEEASLKLTATADTHIHADYLSGSRELAERLGVKVFASDCGDEEWKFNWVPNGSYDHLLLIDGDDFYIGNIKFKVLHTPGHTSEHISFLVTDTKTVANHPMGVLSGDFIFVGDVGRPDLLESAVGQLHTMKPAAERLYNSIQQFKLLPHDLQLWPGHGSGSSCGKDLGAVPISTVGYELKFNAAINAGKNQDEFIDYILDGQPEPPVYFSRMKKENRDGPALLGNLPKPPQLTFQKLVDFAENEHEVLLDTRSWEEFSLGHIPGSLFTPLNKAFSTVCGCYVDAKLPVYLIINQNNLSEAINDLIRVGIDNIAGYFLPNDIIKYQSNGGRLVQTEETRASQLKKKLELDGVFLLDVRREHELKETGYIKGAYNISHTRLPVRFKELPADKQLLIQCRTGVRSRYASAYLEKQGFRVSNVAGGLFEWIESGGNVEQVQK
jgi:hydroxyacylglutathione hydrolase